MCMYVLFGWPVPQGYLIDTPGTGLTALGWDTGIAEPQHLMVQCEVRDILLLVNYGITPLPLRLFRQAYGDCTCIFKTTIQQSENVCGQTRKYLDVWCHNGCVCVGHSRVTVGLFCTWAIGRTHVFYTNSKSRTLVSLKFQRWLWKTVVIDRWTIGFSALSFGICFNTKFILITYVFPAHHQLMHVKWSPTLVTLH